MKAGSVGVEYFVRLSDEEIEDLENTCLKGNIKIRNRENLIGIFPLDVMVGEIDSNQIFVEVRTVPLDSYFENATGFVIVLSKYGYLSLRRNNVTGDRMYNNPGCKIKICSKDYDG